MSVNYNELANNSLKILFKNVYYFHMSSSDIDRKIAFTFATNVVDYSKHMKKNEFATLTSLNDFNNIIELLIR